MDEPDGLQDLTNTSGSPAGGVPVPDATSPSPPDPAATPAPASSQSPPPTPGQAQAQAQPSKDKKKVPYSPKLPSVVDRQGVSQLDQNDGEVEVNGDYEKTLASLLNKSLAAASNDRSMAIAMLQVHLDRGEALDELPLAMPVATVISDNTSACLKALELAQKAGQRMHDTAKLLVDAKKADDTALLKAYEAEIKMIKVRDEDNGEWGDTSDLPPGG